MTIDDLPTLAGTGRLESWVPVIGLLAAYLAAVAALAFAGRRAGWPRHVPAGLERVTGLPAWCAGSVGTALFGLMVAGIGFYDDVTWHVARGRDEELFTAPHTLIVVGLGLIFLASAVGVAFATLARADVGVRVGRLRVPWSMVPLGLLGAGALSGFPLDELWHGRYGVDVTMWSPTHLLMIVGASLSPLAAWLALAEAGVRPRDSRWARLAHALVAWLALLGLSSVQGEFSFGVPQFQQLYHPVLTALAAGFVLVVIRLVLGPWWALGIAAAAFFVDPLGPFLDAGILHVRPGGVYIASAVAVELAARLVGTRPPGRFAAAAGIGVATLGLAGEWVWNAGAHQPWTASLLPEVLPLVVLAAVGAAVVGAGLARVFTGAAVPRAALVAAAAALLIALAVPLPRRGSDAVARLDVEPAGEGLVRIEMTLDPADAADDAYWVQALAWQGGGLLLADMEEVEPGVFRAERPMPAFGPWKTMVRVHRGSLMAGIPVYMPADEEIDAPEVPAEDRTAPLAREQQWLMRETRAGPAGFAVGITATVLAIAAAWAAAFCLAAARIGRRPVQPGRAPADRVTVRA